MEIITVETIDNRPTPERRARGVWQEPTGKDASDHMLRDLAPDMIGRLYTQRALNLQQHDAARDFQSIVAAFQAELGLGGYRSCLADDGGGYDAGDGNPAVFAAYEGMKRRLGAVRFMFLRSECDKGPERNPGNLALLRNALDAFSGVDTPR